MQDHLGPIGLHACMIKLLFLEKKWHKLDKKIVALDKVSIINGVLFTIFFNYVSATYIHPAHHLVEENVVVTALQLGPPWNLSESQYFKISVFDRQALV